MWRSNHVNTKAAQSNNYLNLNPQVKRETSISNQWEDQGIRLVTLKITFWYLYSFTLYLLNKQFFKNLNSKNAKNLVSCLEVF